MLNLLLLLSIPGGIVAWIIVVALQSRRAAIRETGRHLQRLREEIAAHHVTAAELQRAKDAAEAANAAKSRYLLSVSHEIRSPLNSIYGYAQLMERGHDVTPVEAAKVIRRSSEHLTNLVEGLLDISQAETGLLRISGDTVRFGALLDQVANMFRPQAQSKGLEFLYERPENPPTFVKTDQKRLRQILINLLSNAIKFTPTGQVMFRVTYRSQMATFQIVDTGIGIAAEDLGRIFDPFERGSSLDANRQKGVGLGLSITHALVRILGGDLTVESEVGRGTTFTVKLLLGKILLNSPDRRSLSSVSGYEGRRRCILLVDDDPAQITVLGRLLTPLGFIVHEALNGADGTAIAERERPDLVLLDISMPGESGWDVSRTLRRMLGEAVRIVMVSANAHEFARGGDGHASHDMFLMKPVDLDALLDVMADQLGIRWINDVAPEARAGAEAGARPAIRSARLPDSAAVFLAEIEEKALIGHVKGIEARIAELRASVPEAEELAGRLLAHLDQFDLAGLVTAIRASR